MMRRSLGFTRVFPVAGLVLGTVTCDSGVLGRQPNDVEAAGLRSVAVVDADESDRATLTTAASRGITEVALAGLAQQRSHDDDVRAFARYVVDEHSKMQHDIAQLAQRKAVLLPTELDPEGTKLYASLVAANDGEFDRQFLGDMMGIHENTVKLLEAASQASSDDDVRTWAQQTLTLVQEHLMENARVAKLVDQKPKGPADPQF